MKTAIYFMKLFGTGAIALCGFIVFLCELISNYGSAAGAFRGLALCGFGAFLLAYVLDTCKCPIKLSVKISKVKADDTTENTVVADAPVEEAATEEAATDEAPVEEATSAAPAEAIAE